jgi:predicted RNase H-like HicB family nuclease
MDVQTEIIEALTGFLDLPLLGQIRLDFLITYESDAFYIRCLDFGIMSCGETIEECKENIKEAIEIYLQDLPEGQSLFKPSSSKYWQMFYELRYHTEQKGRKEISHKEKRAIEELIRKRSGAILQYA